MSLSKHARSIADRIRRDANNKATWLQHQAGGRDDTPLRDGNADNLADLAEIVADMAEMLEPVQ
jgi:hypothetical protein